MGKSRSRLIKCGLAICAAIPVLLFAYEYGPDAGECGVPGESLCTSCHIPGGTPGAGSVTVTFAGAMTYTPGVKQHLQVVVADPAQKSWGFQLTARTSSSSSTQAGTFTPGSDGYTQLSCAPTNFRTEQFGSPCSNTATYPLQYIEHTTAGTRPGTKNSATFDFDWTPPATNVGNIVIYVAGNAANGDLTDLGDHIYTAKYTLSPVASSVPQPAITTNGVVNGAGFQQSIAPGSWVTISGSNLSNSTRTWGAADLVNGLPASLDGVSVSIDNKPAYVYYISPTQLNVLAAADSATGPVSVTVTNNGVASSAATVQLLAQSPALFLWGGKYAVTTRQDFSLVGPTTLFPGSTTPAKPGDVVILWGTGLGPTTPTAPDGQLASSTQLYSVTNPPTVMIGGAQATVYAAALAPGFAGLYQIAIQIPTSLSDGDQPLVLQSGSVSSPSGVFVTIQH